MAFKYSDENSSLKAQIIFLKYLIIGLFAVIAFTLHGWDRARDDILLRIPPDLRSGAVLKRDEIGPANVYAFASDIFQQLNHWQIDGKKNYGEQISNLVSFFTPGYTQFLLNDLDEKGRKGELEERVRGIQTVPGQGYEERRVDILDENTWVVWLDFYIKETYKGMDVKNVNIRYPIRVVRYNVDPVLNPWGMALDGYAGEGPKPLTEAELVSAKAK